MASAQNPMSVTCKGMKPPLESMSWVFVDTKPGIVKYDVKHTQLVTIGQISKKMEEEEDVTLSFKKFSTKIGEKIIDWRLEICIGGLIIGLGLASHTEFPIDYDGTINFSLIDRTGSKNKTKSKVQTFSKTQKPLVRTAIKF